MSSSRLILPLVTGLKRRNARSFLLVIRDSTKICYNHEQLQDIDPLTSKVLGGLILKIAPPLHLSVKTSRDNEIISRESSSWLCVKTILDRVGDALQI